MKHKEVRLKPAGKKLRFNITFKIIAGILLVLVFFSAVSISIGYWQFSERFTEEYADNALRIARTAESYMNTSHFSDYLEYRDMIDKNYEYQTTYERLQVLCDKVGAMFIYVIQPDTTDYANKTYIFNIVNTDSEFSPYPIGFYEKTTNEEYEAKYQKLYDGDSAEEIVVRDKGYIASGSHITAMRALKDDSGEVVGILCVQRQMDALSSARITFTVRVLTALGLIVLVVALVYVFTLNRSLIRPIKRITGEAMRFAEQPSASETPLTQQIRTHDEIRLLADSIDTMESETLQYIDNLTHVTAERQRIGTELELAAQIQQGVLNTAFPEHESFDIYASMKPAKEVGGDFYDFFMIDDDHLCINIADVSGKGIPAALFMMICKIVITDTAINCTSPAEILRIVNERICANNRLDMFVTVWLGILELSTGKLLAANAGHEYPAIHRSEEGFELLRDKHGFVIGGMQGMVYHDYELTLDDGDAFFVYTDGLPEANNNEKELFGIDRVIGALNSEPFTTPQQLLTTVQKQVDAFTGEAPQFDDLTMLCLKFKQPSKSGEDISETHRTEE